MLICDGNLIESMCKCLVNTVNCEGVMGKGIALQFKRKYPNMFAKYVEDCDAGLYRPGTINGYYEADKIILNFATKDHWRYPSKVEWIHRGLLSLRDYLKTNDYSIAIPALGCSNGGLSWHDVFPIIEETLGDLPNHIEVYSPQRG